MLAATPQVWEWREISLEHDGLSQVTPTSRAVYSWAAFRSVESTDDFLWFWLTDFNAVVVPVRAFASQDDATTFEAEARRLISTAS